MVARPCIGRDELRDACVYVSVDLQGSAVDNALSFLAEVEADMPDAMRIVSCAGGTSQKTLA
jgi:hypothetical protein